MAPSILSPPWCGYSCRTWPDDKSPNTVFKVKLENCKAWPVIINTSIFLSRGAWRTCRNWSGKLKSPASVWTKPRIMWWSDFVPLEIKVTGWLRKTRHCIAHEQPEKNHAQYVVMQKTGEFDQRKEFEENRLSLIINYIHKKYYKVHESSNFIILKRK